MGFIPSSINAKNKIMNFNDPLIGFFGFIVTYFVGRVVSERALKRLSVEEKARLLDAFAGQRTYTIVVILGLFALFMLSDRLVTHPNLILAPAFVLLLIATMITLSVLSYRKLKSLGMPQDYIKSFWLSTLIQYIGIALLLAPMALNFFRT